MHTVVIYQCPTSPHIHHHTDKVVEVLQDEGVAVEVIDGKPDEFDVEVDGRLVAYKYGDQLPPVDQVLEAIENAIWSELPAPTDEYPVLV